MYASTILGLLIGWNKQQTSLEGLYFTLLPPSLFPQQFHVNFQEVLCRGQYSEVVEEGIKKWRGESEKSILSENNWTDQSVLTGGFYID